MPPDAGEQDVTGCSPTGRAPTNEFRFFAGPSIAETTTVLGVSTATVERDWTVAKAWLFQRLASATERSPQN